MKFFIQVIFIPAKLNFHSFLARLKTQVLFEEQIKSCVNYRALTVVAIVFVSLEERIIQPSGYHERVDVEPRTVVERVVRTVAVRKLFKITTTAHKIQATSNCFT